MAQVMLSRAVYNEKPSPIPMSNPTVFIYFGRARTHIAPRRLPCLPAPPKSFHQPLSSATPTLLGRPASGFLFHPAATAAERRWSFWEAAVKRGTVASLAETSEGRVETGTWAKECLEVFGRRPRKERSMERSWCWDWSASTRGREAVLLLEAERGNRLLLVMFNKAAMSSYNFPYVNVLTLLQLIVSTMLLYVMCRWKIISFTTNEAGNMSNNPSNFVPAETLLRTIPLSLTYLLYMLASMESVRGISVPMYTTLRRTTVVFTMVVEYILIRQTYTPSIVASVSLTVIGAFIAGARDLSYDSYGYAIVFVANITTAVYLATVARLGKSSGLNSFGLMWCNGVICAPLLLVWASVSGDLERTIRFPHLYSPGFLAVLLLSCIMAFLLNYTIFLNTTVNSALTQTVCGNLKDFFTVIFGWLLFRGLPYDPLNVIGQCLGFFGSGLYAYCKLNGK